MRVWLDPDKLATLGVTAVDVQNAIAEQNIQVAAGRLGQAPAPPDTAFEFQVNAVGRLSDPAGGMVPLSSLGKQIAAAEFGHETEQIEAKLDLFQAARRSDAARDVRGAPDELTRTLHLAELQPNGADRRNRC